MLRKAEDQRRIKKLWFQVFLLLMIVAGLCGCHREKATYISMESETHSFLEAETFFNEDLDETKETDTQTQAVIYVHVCGCVKVPGVYELEAEARVIDAVEAAGGMTPDADTTSVNLAVVLKDEMRIYIPSIDETKNVQIPVLSDALGNDYSLDGQLAAQTTLVNINTATVEQLTMLSGIGASRAADIIEYRNTYGDFDSIEDLMKVSGIKEGVFEKIKDQITVN